jgi:hypothetical protein
VNTVDAYWQIAALQTAQRLYIWSHFLLLVIL